jgi:hypothetical protein
MTTNYTPEETVKLKELYLDLGNEGLSLIAMSLGKTVPSVRSKLVSMEEYIHVGKGSTRKRRSKKELVFALEKVLPFDCTGLLPSNRDTLEKLLEYLETEETHD